MAAPTNPTTTTTTTTTISARNSAILRECLSTPILRKSAPADAASAAELSALAAELSEFLDYLTESLFTSLPTALAALTPSSSSSSSSTSSNTPSSSSSSTTSPPFPLPSEALDSLVNYAFAADDIAAERLLREIVDEYRDAATAAPPSYAASKKEATECELCEREVPLTYHHLIPREVHKKALKRGWHEEWELNKVAWLCRPCHSTVHRVASNEELARSFHTVELLSEREDVQRWAAYISRQRWGGKGTGRRK